MEHEVSRTGSIGTLKYAVAVLALAVVGAGGYSLHEHHLAKSATAENAQVIASLKSTNAQVEALTAKLNEMAAPKPEASPTPAAKPAASRAAAGTRPHKAATRAEDPRWKRFQTQLDAQGKSIDATRQDLDSAKTELNGSIARTHDELVVLQRKGERNYTEFDVDKSKRFSQHGPFGVKLKKASVKDQYADLELMVDDVRLVKKHVNLYEPATFLATDGDQPVQLVINKITKDHIHGYISAPKYAASELKAMAGSTAPDAQSQSSANAKPRQRLPLPQ
ncbi:MAG TPA: hypothetical protein VMU24_09070 [Candidatus Acidoferrales bacterium]|nr:hypothetical protein [Candidatus Acidoferrales bacterium]